MVKFHPMIVRTSALRFFAKLIAIVALLSPMAAVNAADSVASPAIALTGQRVLILGDSITQDGRYVTFLEYYLHQLAPGEKTDLISIGLSSETVSGLSEKGHPYPRPCVLERLDRALKAVKPKLVVACYGMNDGIYHPPSPERLAAFTDGLRQLIKQVRASGAQLVLLTPPTFDALPLRAKTVPTTAPEFGYGKPYVGYDNVLAEFARIELALNEPGVTVIDLHGPLTTALVAQRANDPAFSFAPDGVHPGDEGHLLVARTILAGLGYKLPPSRTDLATIKAEPLFALVRERRMLRSEAWLPFVGYIREANFKSASVAAAEQAVAHLQREIDAMD